MIYGICNLSIIPVRILNCDKSEMINQLIYGDVFEVLEEKEKWIKIKSMYDDYTGWIDNKQYFKVEDTNKLILNKPIYSLDLVEFIENNEKELFTIPIGSDISNTSLMNHSFDGKKISGKKDRHSIVNIAHSFLNSPYLWVTFLISRAELIGF